MEAAEAEVEENRRGKGEESEEEKKPSLGWDAIELSSCRLPVGRGIMREERGRRRRMPGAAGDHPHFGNCVISFCRFVCCNSLPDSFCAQLNSTCKSTPKKLRINK